MRPRFQGDADAGAWYRVPARSGPAPALRRPHSRTCSLYVICTRVDGVALTRPVHYVTRCCRVAKDACVPIRRTQSPDHALDHLIESEEARTRARHRNEEEHA